MDAEAAKGCPPASAPLRGGRWRFWPWVGLAIAIAGLRLWTYHEPLERDITWYAILGHEVLAGRSFYSELWFHKPPAVKIAFAAAELLAGYGPGSVYLLNVITGIAVLMGVSYAGGRMGGRAGALWSGVLWVIVSGEPNFQANQPNTEVFMNVCTVCGFGLLLSGAQRGLTWGETVGIGISAALASLFKQIGVLPILLPAGLLVLWPAEGAGGRRKAVLQWLAMGGIVAASWGLMLAYFAAVGRWTDTYEALFVYNAYYATLSRDALQPLYLVGFGLLFVPWGLAWYARDDFSTAERRAWGLYAGGCLGACLAIVLPGRYFAHYFQLLLPWVAIACGASVPVLRSVILSERRAIEQIALAALVIPLGLYEASFYLLSPQEWSVFKYHGSEFVQTYEQGAELNQLLLPGETFYDFGHSTGLYFASGRKPPSGMLFVDPLTEGPLQRKLSQRVHQEIEQAKPEVLVVTRGFLGWLVQPERTQSGEFFRSLLQQYEPFADNARRPLFLLFARRDGRLARTGRAAAP